MHIQSIWSTEKMLMLYARLVFVDYSFKHSRSTSSPVYMWCTHCRIAR